MMARLPTVVALDYRRRHGLPRIAPDPDLSFSENFFHMCFGEVPEPAIVRAFDVSLILYAEHSFNASILAQRLVRRVCTRCRETCVPSDVELERLQLTADQAKKIQFHKGSGLPALPEHRVQRPHRCVRADDDD